MQDNQKPVGSGFGSTTTAQDVDEAAARGGADITAQVIVVTGGYSGLGLEVTRVLSAAGATVIVPARDAVKAAGALHGLARVEQEALDLADPVSIAAFADRMLSSGRVINVLINNAGVMAVPLNHDARGFETHLAINHLGHADLTRRLWPALVAGAGARVINLTSRGYRFSPVDFADPNFHAREYEKWAAYGQSMSAKAMFAIELDRLGRPHGVRSFAVHPGTILTDLSRHLTRAELIAMGAADDSGAPLQPTGYKTVAQGAATTVWAAIAPELDGHGGLYLDDVEIAPIIDSSTDLFGPGVDAWLIDPEQHGRLWALTDQLLESDFLATALLAL